jgi:hypothetical protein
MWRDHSPEVIILRAGVILNAEGGWITRVQQRDMRVRKIVASDGPSFGMEGGGIEIVRRDSTPFNALYGVQVMTSDWSPA